MKSTNYYNAFIAAAEDCPAKAAEVPAHKGDAKTIANLHFDMIAAQPYQHTSDDVIFSAFAARNGISSGTALKEAREQFFRQRPGLPALLAAREALWLGHSQQCRRQGGALCHRIAGVSKAVGG